MMCVKHEEVSCRYPHKGSLLHSSMFSYSSSARAENGVPGMLIDYLS